MAKNNSKEKLKMAGQQTVMRIIIDALLLSDKITGIERGIEYYNRVLSELKNQYRKEQKTEEVIIATYDLEVLIHNIKTGKEPEWKNKITTDG